MIEIEIHTDDSLHKRICEMYWRQAPDLEFALKVKEITEITGLSASKIVKIVKASSTAWSLNTSCVNCESKLPINSRQDYIDHKRYSDQHKGWVCSECQSNEAQAYISKIENILKEHASAKRERLAQERRRFYTEKVHLLALIKHSASEDMTSLLPQAEIQHDLLTPRSAYSTQSITYLYMTDYLAIDPESDKNSMTIVDGNSIQFCLDRVHWQVVNAEHEKLGPYYTDLEKTVLEPASAEDFEELQLLVDEITLNECIAYLEDALYKHSLDFKPGAKTEMILKTGLEHYSVSQMYSFIWRAARDSAAYYQRERIPKRQAANSAITRLEKGIEKALAEGWTVQEYRRDYTKNQSALSRLVFNSILSTSDGGFHMSKAAITELIQSKINAGQEPSH